MQKIQLIKDMPWADRKKGDIFAARQDYAIELIETGYAESFVEPSKPTEKPKPKDQ